MKEKVMVCVLAMVLLAGCGMTARAEEVSGVAWHLEMYGGEMPGDVLAWMDTAYAPETVDLGEVTITFAEVLCDGRWLYTSALAVPNDPEAVLLIPGSAWTEDLVSGGYGEAQREDDRTFLDAAAEDGKRLLMVYVYPELLNDLPEYFLDHFQLADDVSMLLSGGMALLEGESLETNWHIQVFEIDLETGERVPGTDLETTRELKASILGPMEERVYAPLENAPFETLTLIQTPLAVYAQPQWEDEEAYYTFSYTLLDGEGKAYDEGASSEAYAYAMDTLPDALSMELWGREEGEEGTALIPLEAIE